MRIDRPPGADPGAGDSGGHRDRRCLPGRGGQLRHSGGRGDCSGRRGQRRDAVRGPVEPHPGGGGLSGNPPGRAGGPLRGTRSRRGHFRGGGHAPGAVEGGRGGKRPFASGGSLHQHGGELPVFQGPAGGAGPGYGNGHDCRGNQRFSLLPGPYDCPEAGLEDHRRPGGAALVVAHRELLFAGGLRRGEDEPV